MSLHPYFMEEKSNMIFPDQDVIFLLLDQKLNCHNYVIQNIKHIFFLHKIITKRKRKKKKSSIEKS